MSTQKNHINANSDQMDRTYCPKQGIMKSTLEIHGDDITKVDQHNQVNKKKREIKIYS